MFDSTQYPTAQVPSLAPASTTEELSPTPAPTAVDEAPVAQGLDAEPGPSTRASGKREAKDAGEPTSRRAKKAKKPVKIKVASWKELEGPRSHASFQRFPVEIMDSIVNVDSDLELRDHLALAATCRYFRACYNDIVWQVLFYALVPEAADRDRWEINIIDSDKKAGRPLDQISNWVRCTLRGSGKRGPYSRPLFAARHIFSSGPGGGPGAARWGQSEDEWLAGAPERVELEAETIEAILRDPKSPRRYERSQGLMAVAPGIYTCSEIYAELTAEEQTQYPMHTYDRKWALRQGNSKSVVYDAWPSEWRSLVVALVNGPCVTKGDAKKVFKISEAYLLSVPQTRRPSGRSGWRVSTLQSLALRRFGGAAGHMEHKEKLERAYLKGLETRRQNGTVQISKYNLFYSGYDYCYY